MTATSCRSCNRVCRDAFICRTCERMTRRRLQAQAHLAAELEVTMTRQAKLGERGDGGKSAETPVPFSPPAAEVLRDQQNILGGWCRLIAEEGIGTLPEVDTVAAMADRVAGRLPELRRHEAAGYLVAELADITARGIEAIDLPEIRHRFIAGPCPQMVENDTCAGSVQVSMPRDQTLGPTAACRTCGHHWDSTQWLRMGMDIDGRRQRERAQRDLAWQIARGA